MASFESQMVIKVSQYGPDHNQISSTAFSDNIEIPPMKIPQELYEQMGKPQSSLTSYQAPYKLHRKAPKTNQKDTPMATKVNF